MKELDLLNEKVFAPVVHDEEAPERTLEVRDSEIKAEKVCKLFNKKYLIYRTTSTSHLKSKSVSKRHGASKKSALKRTKTIRVNVR